MGVSVKWDNKAAGVQIYTVEGRWSWEDMFAAIRDARQMADEVALEQVNSIIDIRAGSLFPQNALTHFRRLSSGDGHPKVKAGIVVLVGDNFFVKALVDIMSRWNYRAMQHFTMTKTLDEAREFLVEQANDQEVAHSA